MKFRDRLYRRFPNLPLSSLSSRNSATNTIDNSVETPRLTTRTSSTNIAISGPADYDPDRESVTTSTAHCDEQATGRLPEIPVSVEGDLLPPFLQGSLSIQPVELSGYTPGASLELTEPSQEVSIPASADEEGNSPEIDSQAGPNDRDKPDVGAEFEVHEYEKFNPGTEGFSLGMVRAENVLKAFVEALNDLTDWRTEAFAALDRLPASRETQYRISWTPGDHFEDQAFLTDSSNNRTGITIPHEILSRMELQGAEQVVGHLIRKGRQARSMVVLEGIPLELAGEGEVGVQIVFYSFDMNKEAHCCSDLVRQD